MNAERLLARYETIADAPDAIARLRRFILDLAVRGKLVPQDAHDEPASELLKRIAKEKARLVKVGKIRKPKPSEPIRNDELPIELPINWALARLCEIGNLSGGMTPSMNRSDFWDGDIVWLSPKDIKSDEVSDSDLKISALGLAETRLELYSPGCLFMVARSGILKRTFPVAINRVPAAANQDMKVLAPFLDGQERYLQIMLRGLTDFLVRELVKTGTTVQSLKYAEFEQQPFPLPPLAEQQRIVAKVDELMGLCNRLEVARAGREAMRDRLAAASLARLNAPNPETVKADACFALDALPALTTRPDQIKALRQTILNLAVRGKLVPQNSNDEPILATLNRAMARRAALVKAKKVRAKKLDGFDELEADADSPSSWALERLGNLVDPENTISYGVLVPGEEVPDGIPFVRAQDLALSGHSERPNKTIAPEIEKAYARTRLRGGEILVCVVGSIGKLGIVPQSWAGANIARAVARIMPISEISREYLLLVLRGEPVQTYFNETTRTLAQPTLNVGLIEQTPIPLPPLAEQHRIVAKVDALMALCDRLVASLAAAAATRRRLLDALLAEALARADDHELEAAE